MQLIIFLELCAAVMLVCTVISPDSRHAADQPDPVRVAGQLAIVRSPILSSPTTPKKASAPASACSTSSACPRR
ncbi:hypothetical protein M8494_20045 [Serratia ureilytica]